MRKKSTHKRKPQAQLSCCLRLSAGTATEESNLRPFW